MKRYKVLKEFIGRNGKIHRPNDKEELEVYDAKIVPHEHTAFYAALELAGYIEELKEAGLWSRGVKIPANATFWKLRTRGDASIDCVNDVTLYDVAFGLAFRTKKEAEDYAEHLKLENKLINIAVREYDAKIKYDDIYEYCAYISEDNYCFGFYGASFSRYSDAVLFEAANIDKLRLWANYFVEEE